MSNQMRVVQPMGKFGAAYLLSRKKYIYYRASSVIFYLAIIGVFFVSVAAGAFGITNDTLRHEIVATGLVVAALGILGVWKVVSNASVAVGQAERPTFEKFLFLNIRRAFCLASCVVFLLMFGFAVIVQIFIQHIVDPKTILCFSIFLILAIPAWKRFRGS